MNNSTTSNSAASPDAVRNTFPPVPRPITSSRYVSQTSSAALVIVVTLCTIFLLTSFNRLNHEDLWSHLSYGRWISETGDLPSSDPFVARMDRGESVNQFVNVPWLAQWSAYQLYRIGGAEGLVLTHAALVTTGAGLLMFAIVVRGAGSAGAAVGGVMMYLLLWPHVDTFRPQLWGIVAFPLVLLGIRLLYRRRHPMFWLPGIFLLWANLHVSFIVGLGMLGIFAVACMGVVRRKTDPLETRLGLRACWLFAICFIAGCCNPAGPRLLVQVASAGGNLELESFFEWEPIMIKSIHGLLFVGSLLIICLVIWVGSKKFDRGEAVLLIVFGLFAMCSTKMLTWWCILWPGIVIPHLMNCWSRAEKMTEAPTYPPSSRATMRTFYALGCILIVLCWSPASRALISGQSLRIGQWTTRDTPLYVAEQMRQRGLTGRIMSPLDWGGYLIWHTQGAIQPMVYSQVHLQQSKLRDDFLCISRGDSNWVQVVDQYDLDYLILSRKRNNTLRRDIEQHPRASILYQDEQSVLVQLLKTASAYPGRVSTAP